LTSSKQKRSNLSKRSHDARFLHVILAKILDEC